MVLVAGVKTSVLPPVTIGRQVSVGNATTANLEVHSTDDDNLHYLNIAAGFDRSIPTSGRFFNMLADRGPVFWLKSAPGGTVVLLWH